MGRPKVSDTIWINYIALDEDLWEAVHQYDSGHQIAQLCGTRLEVVAWARARRAVSKLIFSVVEEDFVPLADMYEAPPEGDRGTPEHSLAPEVGSDEITMSEDALGQPDAKQGDSESGGTIWIHHSSVHYLTAAEEDRWWGVHQSDDGRQIADFFGSRGEVIAWARRRTAARKMIFSRTEKEFVPLISGDGTDEC